MNILDLFSVNTIFFTIFDYPMSYIEFIGTILYLWSVWLISKNNILTWPVGIISVILYMLLFYQIRLYSDAAEQIYYLGASIYGWWAWDKSQKAAEADKLNIRLSQPRTLLRWLAVTALGTILLTLFVSRLHLFLPTLFPDPAAYPFIDALTTVMSFTAMFLMAQRRLESWYYWIIVDIIGIWLYAVQGVRFISLLYVILLIMAINGLRLWLQERNHTTSHAY
ncbi:MAG TPA: nicotinamide riboside transporter PnuC [Anaerolineae bacterium]|nr:nicotinamide riboside transporter PnuC [Anaerolineae bacterium]